MRPSGSSVADRREVALAFEAIRKDRTHGASELSSRALDSIALLLQGWESRPPRQGVRAAFRELGRALERAQPAMGSFRRWANDWQRLGDSRGRHAPLREARAWLRDTRRSLANEGPRLVETCRQHFLEGARSVVTLSRSSSVLLALASLPRRLRPARVSVLESLPGGEGRLFVRDLRRAGLLARLVPDRTGPDLVRSADLLLLGADAVDSDGSVVHKVGTARLARSAWAAGVPVVVVAGRSKFTERRPGRRPLPTLFDRTPSRYVSEYWTDFGVRRGRAKEKRLRRSGSNRRPRPRGP